MDFNKIGKLICKQAQEKGWGHTKENLVVSEKMILISTEITELEEAKNTTNPLPKDSMASEYADILMRTLHLGTAWGVDFNKEVKYHSKIKSTKGSFEKLDLLYLHNLVAKGYEYYRHKKIKLFKKYLYILAHEVFNQSQTESLNVEKGVLDKMKINKPRVWDKSRLNGNYYK